MRELNLCAKGFHRRKPSYGKEKAIEQVIKENLLNRQFNQSQIDAIWVTDITYISCADGRLYLSTYIDLATRIPRCYEVDTHMRKEIVIQPLERYKGSLPSVVHSDRGSQYRSHSYQEFLTEKQTTHSMSHPGTPVDNAVIESFHRSIKRKLIEPNKHKTRVEMSVLILDYLTDYYINKRIHTKFMMTPRKFGKNYSGHLTDCQLKSCNSQFELTQNY